MKYSEFVREFDRLLRKRIGLDISMIDIPHAIYHEAYGNDVQEAVEDFVSEDLNGLIGLEVK